MLIDFCIETSSTVLPINKNEIMYPPVSINDSLPAKGSRDTIIELKLPIDISESILKFNFFIFLKLEI